MSKSAILRLGDDHMVTVFFRTQRFKQPYFCCSEFDTMFFGGKGSEAIDKTIDHLGLSSRLATKEELNTLREREAVSEDESDVSLVLGSDMVRLLQHYELPEMGELLEASMEAHRESLVGGPRLWNSNDGEGNGTDGDGATDKTDGSEGEKGVNGGKSGGGGAGSSGSRKRKASEDVSEGGGDYDDDDDHEPPAKRARRDSSREPTRSQSRERDTSERPRKTSKSKKKKSSSSRGSDKQFAMPKLTKEEKKRMQRAGHRLYVRKPWEPQRALVFQELVDKEQGDDIPTLKFGAKWLHGKEVNGRVPGKHAPSEVVEPAPVGEGGGENGGGENGVGESGESAAAVSGGVADMED